MRILKLSDLHQYSLFNFNLFFNKLPSKHLYDIVVIAGDSSNGNYELLKYIISKFEKPVYFVLGNHDYYHRSISEVIKFCLDNNLNLLHGSNEFKLNYNDKEYTLIGGTGWSSFNLYDEKPKEFYKKCASYSVNDFNLIYTDSNTRITPNEFETLHNTEWNFYSQYKNKENVILITHFPMSEVCLDPFYSQPDYKDLNPYFINNKNTEGFKLILSGHCVDLKTEILTLNGWKFRKDLLITDKVYTFNSITNCLELKPIVKITDMNYTGDVYSFGVNSIDQRITDKHRVVGFDSTLKYKVILADELSKRKSTFNFLRSGYINNLGISLSDNLLKLYITINADGSLSNKNLVRFSLNKDRKKNYIKKLLNLLNITYRCYDYEPNVINGRSSINFTLPKELIGWNLKGLDTKLLKCNQSQFKLILDAYSNTDGCIKHNSFQIFTSKEKEMNILSHLAVINGFMCNISSRIHGFSKKLNYTLSITEKTIQGIQKPNESLIKEHVVNEPFWCISVENENFMMRRNGKISLTGNTHTCINKKDIYGCTHIINAYGYSSEFNRIEQNNIVGSNGFDSHLIINTDDYL